MEGHCACSGRHQRLRAPQRGIGVAHQLQGFCSQQEQEQTRCSRFTCPSPPTFGRRSIEGERGAPNVG